MSRDDSPIMRFNPPGMAFAGMSQAVGCGSFVLVSGQVALKDGAIVGIGDAKAQAEQCFANIAAALAEAGLTLADVASLRCSLTDRDAYGGYAEVKNALFTDAPPCSTVVIVAGLLMPELLMEVEAVAWRSAAG